VRGFGSICRLVVRQTITRGSIAITNPSQLEALFFAALETYTVAQRAAFLESACAGDAELRRQLEKMLDAHNKLGDFLKRPVAEQLGAAPGKSGDDESGGLDFLEPATRPDSLGRLGHFEVMEVLGQGGFGIVYRALDESLQRVVAIKVLAPQLATTSPARKRFLREARATAQVRHENVVQVYAVEEKPLPYLAMEFIPGETLQQRLDRVGPLEVPEILRIGQQIARGLAAAHAMDLIHRDIKPANVLIETSPQYHIKITDFGLARAANDASLSCSGAVVGTPMYMSPEQARGESFDHRADLFSLGSVLYVMATGRPPFRASNMPAVLRRVVEDQPRPIREVIPDVPEWLCGIVAKLHDKDPAARFQTAREVADLLADCEAKLKAHQEVPNTFQAHSVQPADRRASNRLTSPTCKPGMAGRQKWMAAAAVFLPVLALTTTELAGVTQMFRIRQPLPDSIQPFVEPKPALQITQHQTSPNVLTAQELRLLSVAPLDAAQARGLQAAWARRLGVPIEATSKIGMKLILIPPLGEEFPTAYYLGKYEVTQAEWQQVMADSPSNFGPENPLVAGMDTSKFPVEQVSWFDSVEFCNKLSESEGLQPWYELTVTRRSGAAIEEAEVKMLGGSGYQIPTDSQWSHASRAGTNTKYHFGDSDEELPEYAWINESRTHTVGTKKPNAFGLYDMQGNVWEWCNDESSANPTAPERTSRRVFRGGSWNGSSEYCEASYFFMRLPSDRIYGCGLRVARTP
jgi:eukaryotic-like serine/threonine-protein kinase